MPKVNVVKKLASMRSTVETAKTRLAETEGELKGLFKQLSKKFDADNREQAEKVVAKMERQVRSMKNKLEKDIAILERHYDI